MGESSLAQDFVAGVDPFGIYTSSYGQKAEQKGVSEGRHAVKKLTGAAGGALGGAVILPTAVSGIAGAIGGGRGRGLARVASGFLQGAASPWRALSSAITARQAISRAAKSRFGTQLTKKEREAMRNLMSNARLKDVFGGGGSLAGGVTNAVGAGNLLLTGRMNRSFARRLQPSVDKGLAGGVAGLGIGGLVGAGGASVQYDKGRRQERGFQRRIAMSKLSSAESAALDISFLLESQKIASSRSVAKRLREAAYRAGRRFGKEEGILRSMTPAALYREFSKGRRGEFRDLKDLLKAIGPAAVATGISGGAGVAVGDLLAKKRKKGKKEQLREAFASSQPDYGEY